jgi:glutathione synthase
MKKKTFLWITDPWSTLDHPKDTTLRLAEEALALGFENHWADVKTLRLEDGRVVLDVRQIEGVFPGRGEKAFRLAAPVARRPSEFGSIHYRVDPPVDLAYLHPLQLLAHDVRSRSKLGLGRPKSEIVNPALALFRFNEKFEAARLKELMPPSLVASQWEALERFGRAQGQTVLKPLHEAQSKGVELLIWDSPAGVERAETMLRATSAQFSTPVLLQRYLPGIQQGEQRLWFVDGRLLGCVRKLPKTGDFRVNLDQGSRVVATELSRPEARAARKIGEHLRRTKIRLAAVDLIEGYITDFNFTSPGLIPQMEFVLGVNLARDIILALAR